MLSRLYTPRKNREDGFTLIELLIVVIIIGILAAIALPIFLNQQKAANDAAAVSDVRNTVDSVQTFLVKNSGTAYANTGAYVTAGGAATISNGDTIGVNIGADGSYQVCGYVTNGSGNQYTSASSAYTYTTTGTAAGTFAKGSCSSGSDSGGANGTQAQGTSSGLTGGVVNGVYTATAEANDSTNSYWTADGTNVVFTTAQAHSGSRSVSAQYSPSVQYGSGLKINGLPAGKTYTFTAWVYVTITNGAANSTNTIYTYNTATNKVVNTQDFTVASNTWNQISLTATIPASSTSTSTTYFVIHGGTGGGAGVVYVDDIVLTPTN